MLVAAAWSGIPAAAASDPLAECEAAVAAAPDRYDSYLCFYRRGLQADALAVAAERLDGLRVERPETAWPLLVRAHAARSLREEPRRCAELYREAAERFAATSEPLGEVVARNNLRNVLLGLGDLPGAEEQVHLALELAERTTDRETKVRAAMMEAAHLTRNGRNLGRAYRAIQRARAAVSEIESPVLEQSVVRRLADVAYYLGRYDEAIDALERLIELQEEFGNLGDLPSLRYSIANTRLAQREQLPVEGSLEELHRLAAAALAAAELREDPHVAARAHALLGDFTAPSDLDLADDHYRQCLDLARALDRRQAEMDCLWSRARSLARRRPAMAEAALERAAALAITERDPRYAAFVWQARLRSAWSLWPAERAVEEALLALEAVERTRAAQADAEARIGAFSGWAQDYYLVAGRLLQQTAPDLELAFEISERLRARVLLEALERAEIADEAPPATRNEAVERIRAEIAEIQRRLLDPALAPAQRSELLGKLRSLELDEEELDADGAVGGASHSARGFVTVTRIQQQLEPDEALVAYMVGLDRNLYGETAGGAWVFVISTERAFTVRVPGRLELESVVPAFVGLVSGAAEVRDRAAAALYRKLLGEALARLGPAIERLVIVPDGALHRLPFEALRPESGASSLGVRYELTVAPSATLWSRWRESTRDGRGRVTRTALVLADPEIPFSTAAAPPVIAAGGPLERGLALERLPRARREGKRVCAALGGDCRLLVAAEANEEALEASGAGPVGVLHLAAHAIVDEAFPERSAVVLAPGAADEDGLLQPREAARLAAEPAVVVLSACRTAAGPVASGEGVLSLARPFLEGGARAVVASRWPLRDDEAARFFEWFYESLARGDRLAAALRHARSRAERAGLGAATTAGVFLLGDGALRLEAPARTASTGRAGLAVRLLLVAVPAIALGLLLARRRRARRRGAE